jgi:L-alanine-DL-glutamate epimerase-like enolase superfamily enzyme
MGALARAAAPPQAARPGTKFVALRAFAYTIPTDLPEADGTFAWDSTTLVLVEVEAGGETGIGYTYTSEAALPLITGGLWRTIRSCDPMDTPGAWRAMNVAVRNIGRDGVAANAISAVDTALWDLKARLLDQPLALVLGRYRDAVPIYGSGGFTTYTDKQLSDQLAGWVERDGCAWVKMKIGTHPEEDRERVRVAKNAIGRRALFVDANGAYRTKQALEFAEIFAREADIRWFEEPVSSDDLAGLSFIRQHAPAGIEIAAGEYGYDIDYFRIMLSSGAVDVQQADVTRCGGYTGFLQVAALCEAHHIDLSGHCAPSLHLPVACAVPRFRHLEWFHDHVRIEHMLFEGAPRPKDGMIQPDLSRPGHGLEFKFNDAERFRVG